MLVTPQKLTRQHQISKQELQEIGFSPLNFKKGFGFAPIHDQILESMVTNSTWEWGSLKKQ